MIEQEGGCKRPRGIAAGWLCSGWLEEVWFSRAPDPCWQFFLSEDYIESKRLGGFFGASTRRKGGFAERFSFG
jgi:hypothetical protein